MNELNICMAGHGEPPPPPPKKETPSDEENKGEA
jgi:hypothetical protein